MPTSSMSVSLAAECRVADVDAEQHRTAWDRCVRRMRPMRSGSMRGATFNIASATLGAGALSLPYAFRQAGLLLGIFWLVSASLATVYSIKLLLVASRLASHLTGNTLDSYEDLAGALFGRMMKGVVEAMIILFCYGTAIAYCVAVGDILEPIRAFDFMPAMFRDPDHGRTAVMLVFWAVLMFPLSLLRSMNSLQFSSILGVSAILFLCFATIYHCVTYGFINKESPGDGKVAFVNVDVQMVTSLPLIMFAFTCQVNVYDIYRELREPTEAKMMRISWQGMLGVCAAVYGMMGIFGYLDFTNEVNADILVNLQKYAASDAVVAVAFLCIALTVVVAFPLVVFPCRESIFSIIHAPKNNEERNIIIDIVRSSVPRANDGVCVSRPGEYVVGPTAKKRTVQRARSCPDMRLDVEQTRDSIRSGSFHVTPNDADELHLQSFNVEPDGYFVPPVPSRVYRQPPLWQHYLLSAMISTSAIIFAILMPGIQIIFSFLGGVCSSFLCFVFPAMCIRRLEFLTEAPVGATSKIATALLLWGGVAAGVLSTAVTVYNMMFPAAAAATSTNTTTTTTFGHSLEQLGGVFVRA